MSGKWLVLVLQVAASAAEPAVDLCTVAESKGPQVVTIRGTGGTSRDGTLLFDYTCVLAEGRGFG
jgi:hypothetical protein